MIGVCNVFMWLRMEIKDEVFEYYNGTSEFIKCSE
jgi:hypothetical protein